MVKQSWINSYIKEQDVAAVESAIGRCEQKTSAEVVPVVVRASSQYYQAEVTLRLIGGALFVLLWFFMDWDLYWDQSVWAIGQFVTSFLILIVGLPWLARFDRVKKLMTHRNQELEQVWKRAQIEFYANCVHQTQEQEGVLIYVSLLERWVIVLADKKISDQLPPETWDEVVQKVVSGIKHKKLAQGLIDGMELCSSLLSEHFPITSNDIDELPNKLIIKE